MQQAKQISVGNGFKITVNEGLPVFCGEQCQQLHAERSKALHFISLNHIVTLLDYLNPTFSLLKFVF